MSRRRNPDLFKPLAVYPAPAVRAVAVFLYGDDFDVEEVAVIGAEMGMEITAECNEYSYSLLIWHTGEERIARSKDWDCSNGILLIGPTGDSPENWELRIRLAKNRLKSRESQTAK